MTAKEARQLAITACSENIEWVMSKVKERAGNGGSQIGLTGVKPGSLLFLQDNGFELRIIDGDTANLVTISW